MWKLYAGVPLTLFGAERKEFRDYLWQKERISFTFEGVHYSFFMDKDAYTYELGLITTIERIKKDALPKLASDESKCQGWCGHYFQPRTDSGYHRQAVAFRGFFRAVGGMSAIYV